MKTNSKSKPVCVVIGATSKWQSDGRNTILAHGHAVDDSDVEVGVRWGVGGAIAQKFAQEGFFTVVTTRNEGNAAPPGCGDVPLRAAGPLPHAPSAQAHASASPVRRSSVIRSQ